MATFNIPLLILISQNLNKIMVAEKRDTLLCLTRDGCLLEYVFKMMYPHHNCVKYYSSRKLHNNYNNEYIDYIKKNYNHEKCIMFDGHGSFKSGRELYKKVFGVLPRIFLYVYDLKDTKYDGMSYCCSILFDDFEHLNSDLAGSIVGMSNGVLIRDKLEYKYEDALVYHNTVIKFCNMIKDFKINEMPTELLKIFTETFTIHAHIKYNNKDEGIPLKKFFGERNMNVDAWHKARSIY